MHRDNRRGVDLVSLIRALLLFFALASSVAFAGNITWKESGGAMYGSASGACSAWWSRTTYATNPAMSLTGTKPAADGFSQYCTYTYTPPTGGAVTQGTGPQILPYCDGLYISSLAAFTACGGGSGGTTDPGTTCPAGQAKDANGVCQPVAECPAGQIKDSNDQCKTDCSSKAGKDVSSGYYAVGSNAGASPPTSVCSGGCLATFNGISPAGRSYKDGKAVYYAQGSYSYSLGMKGKNGSDIGYGCKEGGGGAGAGETPSPPGNMGAIPPSTCGPGQAPGTFNGVFMCVNATTGEKVPLDEGTKAAKTTKTEVKVETAADGTQTTTETTTVSDGSGYTTVTVKRPDGSSSTTKSETTGSGLTPGGATGTNGGSGGSGGGTTGGSGGTAPDSTTFCQDNPTSPICKNGTFSGSCTQDISVDGASCDGDPVACATARATFNTWCTLHAQGNGTTLAEKMANGQDPVILAMGDPTKPIDGGDLSNAISATRTLSGTCPNDPTFSVMHQTIAIPFSSICPHLERLGQALVAIAWLVAIGIVRGGVS